ncbi:uncharacterized protein LOC131659005 [Vicia villosa]|uniref:uncharacterized protein LOC131659005 n=1 Tax=Vicia villosa TaxID=3911 RepID=UPI00273B89DB|nr:uncharacterized protein LOC131659005 [Vicia villosa]
MEQLEHNQAALHEEVTQLKGTVDEIKGGMAQMLSFMKDIRDEQEKAREARNQYEEIPNDGNPLLGFVQGFDPRKSNAHSSKRVTRIHEEGEGSHEGFIPTTQKEGAPCTVRIPANIPPKDEDYVDLQYGEADETNQEPQHKQTQSDSEESARNSGQIKALEERLKAVEGYDEGETNAVVHQESRPPMSFPPQQNRFQGPPRKFDPLPTSRSEILKYLVSESLVELGPMPPPLPGKASPRFNPNERCEFHANSPGHTLEKCWAFRHKVQDLIESGAIAFDKPNVKTNPMPHHDGTVNTIEVVTKQELVQQRSSPIDSLKRYLLARGFILEHNEAFKDTLQRLMDQGLIQLKEHLEEEYVAMLERNESLIIPTQGAKKPLIIPYSKAPVIIPTQGNTRIIPVRAPYPMDKMKAVPWEYNSSTNVAVSNIIGPGGMTRSGRIFKTTQSNENLAPASNRTAATPTEEGSPKDKAAANKDAEEFLALIKKSDYRVVDQLQQTPSKISLLSLLVHSEKHRDALMKILNAAHVTKDITVNQFDGMVANLTAGACLGFSDHELPPQGKEHNKALHISIQCGKAHLSRVLIDTGSSLNVMPKATLDKIDLEGLVVRPSRLVVNAIDGSQSPVFGEVDLPVVVGPHTFCINFQVMEIEPAYTCLLGRPWIHAAGAVTSTLHQKVKFVDGNSIVIVNGEEDIFVSNLDSYRYIEAREGALETSFQALEIATVVTLPIEKIRRTVTSWRDLQDIKMEGWGKIPEVQEKRDRLVLGCQQTKKAAKEEQRFPPIVQTFVTGGYEHVSMISSMEGTSNFIRMIRPGEQLQNWTSLEIPEIVYISK